jgi:glycosyltransferase involved in cell wall biosynthesis
MLTNIHAFCDRIIVADNKSTDKTPEIVKQFCSQGSKVEYHRIDKLGESHDLISPLAGTPAWIFGVDGDEIYDPSGLKTLRGQIKSGIYNDYFRIMGNVFNCVEIDEAKRVARGYLAPPCRSMTKLYNFGSLEAWEGPCSERLHGGNVIYKAGYGYEKSCDLHLTNTWEDSLFRCLHTVFLNRSSKENKNMTGGRLNVADTASLGIIGQIKRILLSLFGKSMPSNYKKEKYMRGEFLEKDISAFLT